jgi:N-acetylglucosaminyl-diphospho-decaprenol L-rhamnosyltransferase
MDLTIIIVNWNTRELLQNCLRSIHAAAGTLQIQTIVVDNNSSDGSREMVTTCFPEFTMLNSGANLGFACGNNLAVPLVKAPFVLFLNPDTEVTFAALAKMLDFMRSQPSAGAIGCRIRGRSGETKQLGLQWYPTPFTELVKYLLVSESSYTRLPRLLPYHSPDKTGEVIKLFGACLMVRRAVLDQVGPFDERFFMYCEDVDLCMRITRAGWRLFYLADAEILHLGGSASSKAASSFSVLMTCESFSKYMAKHHGRIGCASYRVVTFLGSHARLLLLLALRGAQALGLTKQQGASLSNSTQKHLAIIKWSLGLQKPIVRN